LWRGQGPRASPLACWDDRSAEALQSLSPRRRPPSTTPCSSGQPPPELTDRGRCRPYDRRATRGSPGLPGSGALPRPRSPGSRFAPYPHDAGAVGRMPTRLSASRRAAGGAPPAARRLPRPPDNRTLTGTGPPARGGDVDVPPTWTPPPTSICHDLRGRGLLSTGETLEAAARTEEGQRPSAQGDGGEQMAARGGRSRPASNG
jgi:hypothetical protein